MNSKKEDHVIKILLKKALEIDHLGIYFGDDFETAIVYITTIESAEKILNTIKNMYSDLQYEVDKIKKEILEEFVFFKEFKQERVRVIESFLNYEKLNKELKQTTTVKRTKI